MNNERERQKEKKIAVTVPYYILVFEVAYYHFRVILFVKSNQTERNLGPPLEREVSENVTMFTNMAYHLFKI